MQVLVAATLLDAGMTCSSLASDGVLGPVQPMCKTRGSHSDNNASAPLQRDVKETLVGFVVKETNGGPESNEASSTSTPGALSCLSFSKMSVWLWLK